MKKIMASAFVILTVATFSMASGCSSDDQHGHEHTGDGGHVSAYPSCQAIIDKCHPLDVGDPGPINDCHALAHDAKDDATCAAKKDNCVTKVCVPGAADAGAETGADTGAQDAPTGG